ESVKNIYFLIIALAGVVQMTLVAVLEGSLLGTPTYPVTAQLVSHFFAQFLLYVFVIVVFSSGELVWRDRVQMFSQIYDALPVRSWVTVASKIFALIGQVVVLLLIGMATCLVYQAVNGYYRFEIGLYLRALFGEWLLVLSLLVILAVMVQSIVGNKYVGHL